MDGILALVPPKAKRRDPFVGLTLAGKYEVTEPLARGGMGRVYRAIQKPLGREVALKVLDLDLLDGQAAIEDFQQRFFLEAASCAQLQHPNTVVVYDYGKTDDDDVFIAMELLTGDTLQKHIVTDGTIAPPRAIHIALQICGSIGGAHDQGMVHRDLKPSNVMLTARGNDPDFVKVLDFGLVKQEDNGLTQSGALLGTPRYMAPEQISNTNVGPGADIYALGAILYHMITGRPPFDSESKFVLLASHMNEAAPPIREVDPDTPASLELEQVVMRCLRKNPEERYESMEALARALAFCPEDTDTANSSLPRASAVPVPVQAPLGATNVARPLSSAQRKIVTATPGTQAETHDASAIVPRESPESLATPRGPALRLVLFGAILLGAVLAVGLWIMFRPGEDPAAEPLATADPSTEPETPQAPDLGVNETMEAAQASVAVQVASEPPGARVEADGADLGDAPTTIVVRSGETRQVTLTLPGYETRVVEINDRQAEVSVRLRRRRRGGHMRATPTVMETTVMVEMVEVPIETPMTTPMTSMGGMTDNRDPWGG